MTAYGGYFQFQNLTRQNVVTGVAFHESGYGKDIVELPGLAAGGISAPVPFFTSTSENDFWGFYIQTNTTSYQARIGLPFHNNDAGLLVTLQAIIADADDCTFNVVIPSISGASYNSQSF